MSAYTLPMKPFNVNLTESERVVLEGIRATLGLRSQADVIRHWIRLATPPQEKTK